MRHGSKRAIAKRSLVHIVNDKTAFATIVVGANVVSNIPVIWEIHVIVIYTRYIYTGFSNIKKF